MYKLYLEFYLISFIDFCKAFLIQVGSAAAKNNLFGTNLRWTGSSVTGDSSIMTGNEKGIPKEHKGCRMVTI